MVSTKSKIEIGIICAGGISSEKKSNVVHTVTIKDSIICCMKKDVKPQMYSVVNQPQWTWKDVFDYYNDKKIQIIFDESLAQSKNVTSFLWKILKSNKRFFGPILYYLPSKFDLYVQRKLTMKRLHLAISKLQSHGSRAKRARDSRRARD